MPGHKRNAFGEMPREIANIDITEIDGFDNLHQPESLFVELQREAAQLYGAEESFYLINGSTCGVLSAISAALPESGHILLARNCHKSAYHAAYLRKLKISYLCPAILEKYDICDAVTPEQVREALEQESDIGAVFVVSPTYEGRIADIRAIAEIVHNKGIPLIVDEAHGAHLGLAEGFPENSCQAGADLVIHSVHKTLPAMTQTALLHVNGDRIDRERLKRFLRIYQSSSPSYILMAGIENVTRVIKQDGAKLFHDFRTSYSEMLSRLEACRSLRFLPLESRQDIGKLVISTAETGISGQKIYDILRQEYHLQLEMASTTYCLAMFTVGDGPEAYERMTEALLFLDRRIAMGDWQKSDAMVSNKDAVYAQSNIPVTTFLPNKSEDAIPFTEAWDMETEWAFLEEASGCYAGEFVGLYPPGIPLLVPGERIKEAHCKQLLEYIRQGLKVQGIEPDTEDISRYKIRILNPSRRRDSYEKNKNHLYDRSCQ